MRTEYLTDLELVALEQLTRDAVDSTKYHKESMRTLLNKLEMASHVRLSYRLTGNSRRNYASLVDLACRIRPARIAAGMSQCELADHLEVTQPTLSSWESGRSLPHKSVEAKVRDFVQKTEGEIHAAK